MKPEWEDALMTDEIFNQKMRERGYNLSKYYNHIKKCKGCGLSFGIDTHARYDSNYCPLCKTEFQLGGKSPWDKHRQRFNMPGDSKSKKEDSGGSSKARRGSDD